MKTNYLTLSVMALATAFTACSQDNEILETNVSDNAQVLTIQAAESGFEAADKEGRATDEGKTTVFENGDKMGLFVVRGNGSVVKANEPITYDGKKWTPETPVYYYTDADYIAYFPYDEDLSVSATATEKITSGIINVFDEYFKEHKADQSDLATYRNADLMLATITAEDLGDDKTLNFSLKHNYSMIELNIPSHKYSYTYGEGTKEFSVPMSNFVVKLGEEPVTPCHIGNGVYRMLVEPGDINLEGSFEDPKDQRPVNFSNASKTKNLAAGSYVKYNITYTGAPDGSKVETRNIIGDYYCQDGSIYPSDLEAVPTNAIGIIYSTVDGDEFKDEGYQYYVLSIKERKQIGFYVNKNSMTDDEKVAAVKDIAGIAHFDAPTEETYQAFAGLTDMSGYAATTTLRALTPAYSIVTDLETNWVNNDTYAAPATGTTGWFIPSIGQLVKLHDILGENGTPAWTWTNSLMSSNTTGAKAQQKFVSLIERVLPDTDDNEDSRLFNKCTWSATQVTAVDGNSDQFCIEISSSKFPITTKP